MSQTWEFCLEELASRIDPQEFRSFISGLRPTLEHNGELEVEAPNRLAADVIRARYLSLIEETLQSVTNGQVERLVLHVRTVAQQELFAPVHPPASMKGLTQRTGLSQKYTFKNFVVGASNQFAHAAALAVATQPGMHYNPLFIYGGVGLGKTHLVNAIGHQVLDRNPEARVLYLSTESFMNELIAALRRDRMTEFKNRFRRIDVLILDDVQFLAGRERTQEEFFHTFNSLYEGHRQIVLTSDKFPKEIPDLEERLRNRFEWGLIADIQTPDVETRVAILEKKAELERIELPHDVALFLATNIDSNVRELEGSLTRLGAFASLNKSPITIDFATRVLRNVLPSRNNRELTIEIIQNAVCDFFHIRMNDIRSKKRMRTIVLPRQLAMYLCRRHTRASFPIIGDRFGGRDHSTVIHAVQIIEQRMRNDESFRATVDQIERILDRNPSGLA